MLRVIGDIVADNPVSLDIGGLTLPRSNYKKKVQNGTTILRFFHQGSKFNCVYALHNMFKLTHTCNLAFMNLYKINLMELRLTLMLFNYLL